jgi:hypothetical protein
LKKATIVYTIVDNILKAIEQKITPLMIASPKILRIRRCPSLPKLDKAIDVL